MATEWTIETLKALVDMQFAERDKALCLQAAEYNRRLEHLNGEEARLAKSQATYVGREVWDGMIAEDRAWKSRMDVTIERLLPHAEFDAYKESTNRALRLAEGATEGASHLTAHVAMLISAVASVVSVIGVLYVIFRGAPVIH